jgi:hypothetical protein
MLAKYFGVDYSFSNWKYLCHNIDHAIRLLIGHLTPWALTLCGCNSMHCRLVNKGYMGVIRGTIDPKLAILNPSQ